MVNATTQTITVDRISNGGNAIAQQQRAGKSIHVPAGEIGETYEVRLTDKGGYFVAELVDRAERTQPPQPGIGPDTSDIGRDLVNPGRNRSHSYTIRSSITGDRSGGQELRSWMSQRKM